MRTLFREVFARISNKALLGFLVLLSQETDTAPFPTLLTLVFPIHTVAMYAEQLARLPKRLFSERDNITAMFSRSGGNESTPAVACLTVTAGSMGTTCGHW